MTNVEPALFGPKTIMQWDREWIHVPGGLLRRQTQLNHKVGLFRVWWNDEIMAVGVGTQRNGAMAAKLSAFYRLSDSGRRYYAGRLIHEHRSVLDVEVLIIGEDEAGRELARDLKTPMIRRHKPTWTVLNAPYQRK